ncbi:MAG: DnaJ domain-containing protein [Acuticoccus sp.]
MTAFLLLLPLVLGIALIAGGAMLARWFVRTNPATLARSVRSGRGIALVALGVLLLLRGQVMLGGSLVMAGLGGMGHGPGAGGGFSGLGGLGGMGGFGGRRTGRARPQPGQASTVRTAHLAASLDHDSGDMDAEVLAGPYRGRRLSAMSVADVTALWRDLAGEEDSRSILEAYLDRRRPEWREDAQRDGDGGAGGPGAAARGGAMTVDEAYDVLGVLPGASEAEIRASHRRLMKQMHPDQGGSTYLAARLNEAKDILLRKR